MSLELKRKEVKDSFYCVGVPYCDLQNLLTHYTKTGYIAGVYGWRCDVYQIGLSNWAICTGYDPIQNINIDDKKKRAIIKRYNDKAITINNSTKYNNYTKAKRAYNNLLTSFIKAIQKEAFKNN